MTTKKLDPDYRALKACDKYLGKVATPRMRRATLEYLWDKYITHPKGQTGAPHGA